eukprot:TRINITY_DN1098_c0_g1_i1.p1 TRINITY_DN1098_c0_g1~~TRINITY_DN1098_c0_g1_i1.p1  ORF type:complete len:204 (-),score=34.82 TRINITY_DN1098_c0_g1_i1:87-698(-)
MIYITTSNGNEIAQGTICNGKKLTLSGKSVVKPGCIIASDLAKVEIGKRAIICEKVTIRPPPNEHRKKFKAVSIGQSVIIGENTLIEASHIGSSVEIGKNCVIGKRAVIYDSVKVLDNSVVAKDAILLPFSVYGGCPAEFLSELPESTSHTTRIKCDRLYSLHCERKKKSPQKTAIRHSRARSEAVRMPTMFKRGSLAHFADS